MSDLLPTPRPIRPAVVRVTLAIAVALAFSLGVYLLLEAGRPSGLVSFSFLLILPAAISAFVSYVADPFRERPLRAYLLVPLWILVAVIALSIVALREGVICVIILAPLWLGSGMLGAWLTHRLRRRLNDKTGKTYSTALLIAPLLAMQIEPLIALPVDEAVVSRSIVIDSTPREIWPLLRGIPDVGPTEGRWTISLDLLNIPRPIGAKLSRDGMGADRFARWEDGIRFRERIIDWQAERHIGWRFIFDEIAGWGYTDRHLMPDSDYFTITTGGYRVEPLGARRTKITLYTRYRLKTPVNGYSELWGQLFLGDVENNLLAVIKQRAEGRNSALGTRIR